MDADIATDAVILSGLLALDCPGCRILIEGKAGVGGPVLLFGCALRQRDLTSLYIDEIQMRRADESSPTAGQGGRLRTLA